MSDQPALLQTQIEAMMAQLNSDDPAERREAAYFLGEAAWADAVPKLIDLYRRDPDASVRKAAAYSLGMFRAVERALNIDQEYVTELLEQVERGELGSRGGRGIVRVEIGLLVAFVIIGVIALLRSDVRALVFPSGTDRAVLLEDVRGHYTLVTNDTRTLQQQFIGVISGQQLTCNAFFNEPGMYTLNATDARVYGDIAAIVERLNTARDNLTQAKVVYDQTCNEGATLSAEEARNVFQTNLTPALTTLTELEVDFAAAQADTVRAVPTANPDVAPTPVPPSEQPPVEQPPAEQPTAVPSTEAGVPLQLQPTINPTIIAGANPQRHLPALFNIIDTVTGTRGAGTLLLQYWQDVQESGASTGCSVAAPQIPANDVFIEQVDFAASPDLRDAVTLIDSGLATLRMGWANFQQACSARNLRDAVSRGLADAQLAMTAFATADDLLQSVRAGG